MIKTSTPAETGRLENPLGYKDSIMMLGSCFSDEMAAIMKSLYFNVSSNPTGTLYNPESIAGAIRRMDLGEHFTADDTEEVGAGIKAYCSFHHHTSFASASAEVFLEKANKALDDASGHFRTSGYMAVTFGTSWAYRHKGRGITVANCLRHGQKEFERFFLTADDTFRIWDGIVKDFPEKTWIFTVSPIRHLKDGAHGNALSKAALLLAVDKLCACNANCRYFPAFEIMNDELRDYRYYAEDMAHPSRLAVKIIWEKFCEYALDTDSLALLSEAASVRAAANHRPLFPELAENESLLMKNRMREEDFIKKISMLKAKTLTL